MADKLTTALVLHRDRASWTSLRERKGLVEVVQQVSTPLDVPAEATEGGPETTAELKARCSRVRGDVTLVLPASKALLRVVELPSTDPDELRGMAELQVDKFSPFPTDQMCIGHEVLFQTTDSSRVLVAAAPRETLEAIGGACLAAGIMPRAVDIEVMGWLWLLKSKGQIAAQGRQVLLIVDAASSELVVTQDGTPVLLRSLGTVATDPDGAAQEMADEVNYTLTTLETEWGAGPVDQVHVWHAGATDAGLAAALGSALAGVRVHAFSLTTLPPVSEGLARRIHEGRGRTADLAPAEWKASLLSREARRRAALVAGTVMALWVMALFGLFAYARHQQSQQFLFKVNVGRLDKKAGEVRNLQKQVQSLQRYADRSYSALECLREVCSLMPPGPELDAFNYEKYAQINLRGEADSDGPIDEFFKQLQTTKFFPKVQPGQITMSTRNGRSRAQFKATISLPPLPEEKEKKK